MEASATHCQHSGCKCEVSQAHGVRHDGKIYCSERCADNRGCDHHQCNCGVFPTEQPVARQTAP